MSYTDEVQRYYASRTDIYDEAAGYLGKEAEELREPLKDRCRQFFRGKNVLEIACGSGYWTRVIGEAAASVLAVDIDEEIMKYAVERCRDLPSVRFRKADAFTLEGVAGDFNAAAAIWWYSHVPRRRMPEFMAALNSRLQPGAAVMFVDELPHAGFKRDNDENGDTLEIHALSGGRKFSVIKNFPSEDGIRAALSDFGEDIVYTERPGEGRWETVYRTREYRK